MPYVYFIGGFNPSWKYVCQLGSSSHVYGWKLDQQSSMVSNQQTYETTIPRWYINNHMNNIAGWWFQPYPSEKYEFVSWDDSSQYMENKKWSKPPAYIIGILCQYIYHISTINRKTQHRVFLNSKSLVDWVPFGCWRLGHGHPQLGWFWGTMT